MNERLQIAAMAMQGLLAVEYCPVKDKEVLFIRSVEAADALIKLELETRGSGVFVAGTGLTLVSTGVCRPELAGLWPTRDESKDRYFFDERACEDFKHYWYDASGNQFERQL